jgi:hypothetical protein
MASAIFKLEEKGELTQAEVSKILADQARNVLRIDVRGGATTIYYEADKADSASAKLRKRSSEVKATDLSRA